MRSRARGCRDRPLRDQLTGCDARRCGQRLAPQRVRPLALESCRLWAHAGTRMLPAYGFACARPALAHVVHQPNLTSGNAGPDDASPQTQPAAIGPGPRGPGCDRPGNSVWPLAGAQLAGSFRTTTTRSRAGPAHAAIRAIETTGWRRPWLTTSLAPGQGHATPHARARITQGRQTSSWRAAGSMLQCVMLALYLTPGTSSYRLCGTIADHVYAQSVRLGPTPR